MIKLKMILEKIVDSIGAEPFNLDTRGYIRCSSECGYIRRT